MNKKPYLLILIAIVVSVVIIVIPQELNDGNVFGTSDASQTLDVNYENAEVLNIKARAGYEPSILEAKANMPYLLRVETKNTFDCSAALVIPQLNYDEILPPTGFTTINIPPQIEGSEITGSCSMRMYGFKIKFS